MSSTLEQMRRIVSQPVIQKEVKFNKEIEVKPIPSRKADTPSRGAFDAITQNDAWANKIRDKITSKHVPEPIHEQEEEEQETEEEEEEEETEIDEADDDYLDNLDKQLDGQNGQQISTKTTPVEVAKSEVNGENKEAIEIMEAKLESTQVDEIERAKLIARINANLEDDPDSIVGIPDEKRTTWHKGSLSDLKLYDEAVQSSTSLSVTMDLVNNGYHSGLALLEYGANRIGSIGDFPLDLTGLTDECKRNNALQRSLRLMARQVHRDYGGVTDNPYLMVAVSTAFIVTTVNTENISKKKALEQIPPHLMGEDGRIKIRPPPPGVKVAGPQDTSPKTIVDNGEVKEAPPPPPSNKPPMTPKEPLFDPNKPLGDQLPQPKPVTTNRAGELLASFGIQKK